MKGSLPLLNCCLSKRETVYPLLFLHPIQGFPAESENGDNHGKFCNYLVKDTSQGTGHGVVGNPERRID